MVNVRAGWNLLGYSEVGAIQVAERFNDKAKVTTVWKWNANTGKWAFFSPTLEDGGRAYAQGKGYDFLEAIAPGDGFWVNAANAFAFNLSQVKGASNDL